MSSTVSAKRVAVIGGGILGVSTAVHLLRGGASVILLTERGLASEASGRSLSWLNSAGERSTPYHLLRLAGVDRYRTLFAADPSRDWLQFGGGLMWNAAGEKAVTEARHAYEKSVGYDSKLLAPDRYCRGHARHRCRRRTGERHLQPRRRLGQPAGPGGLTSWRNSTPAAASWCSTPARRP